MKSASRTLLKKFGTKSMLIIEDDKETKEYISLVLKSAWPDVDIMSTSFGKEGIQMAKEKSAGLVILDLGLPDINGLEVLREVRSFSNCPVIILTINGINTNKAKALGLGANYYMTKPFEENELIEKIEQLLGDNNSN